MQQTLNAALVLALHKAENKLYGAQNRAVKSPKRPLRFARAIFMLHEQVGVHMKPSFSRRCMYKGLLYWPSRSSCPAVFILVAVQVSQRSQRRHLLVVYPNWSQMTESSVDGILQMQQHSAEERRTASPTK